jgi:hypothetical protein
MSIKFDGLSRIIDEFVDAVDSYGKRLRRCGSASGLRTGGGFDAAMGHYAVQDGIAKIPSVGPAGKALPPQEGVQPSIEWPVGVNRAGIWRMQEVVGESIHVRIDEQRWAIPHKPSCSFVSAAHCRS